MEKSVRKTRTRNFRELELLVWLLVVLVLIIFGFIMHESHLKSFEIHNMLLSDVDGLIVGSPVRYMGVTIGYINKMKMVGDDEIFVRFIVKEKSITLPKGVIANIEFSGMGGSKSIELYPPDKKYVQLYGLDDNEYIIVNRPQRLSDTWSLLYEMFNKLGSIIYKVSNFGIELENMKIEEDAKNTRKHVKNFAGDSEKRINNIQMKINDMKMKSNNIRKCKVKYE